MKIEEGMIVLPKGHEEKFKNYIKSLQEDADYIIVYDLSVLGDGIREVQTNIDLALLAGKEIAIARSNCVISKKKKDIYLSNHKHEKV